MKNTIDALALKKAFIAGANNLDNKKDYINELNVFPVPDGDTGTNMTMTIMSAKREVESCKETMSDIAKAMSTGSLRGARGNSGVILSQLLRGFSKKIGDKTEIGVIEIADAFQKAVETAYKAVMKPKEGTILTVARGIATKARECAGTDITLEEFCETIIKHGDEVLASTPELLPVLKEAGVVDSGGQGLMEVLKGAVDCILGRVVIADTKPSGAGVSGVDNPKYSEDLSADIKFGYCTEFIINLEKPYGIKEEEDLKQFLESIGDSIVCVSDDEIVKIHVHTNHPGQAFEKGLTLGYLSNMKVDNMRLEHHEKVIKQAEREEAARQEAARQAEKEKQQPKKQYGFIAVSMGDGLKEFFTELGVDYVIEGGQTMNPSTEDMLNAIEKVHAENIFIFPNNKNVVLAANQAAGLCEDKNIIVLATANAPQGISAMIAFDSTMTLEDNKNNMLEAVSNVKSGQVTYAVRDTSIDGKAIHEGDIMGIGDKGLVSVGNDISDVTFDLIKDAVDEDSELISIYYGADVKKEDAEAFAARVEESFPDCDVQNYYGGQPIYYYIVSVE
ncbi:MAG: DAK2 domain-containing protein [Clostridium sp.]|uniref:DAK2 domain-containing protein n=1 Tax=Clostridia TaxID=186801 RepID=UPI00015BCFC2|nr:DAK2 domain-containing protein [Clostridium sp. L2-50]MBS6442544.1 DAK2 domain-containing protein [Clostridium sp.]MZH15945.1 DAK2 domain-containing protein [Clostridium sp. BIOML-A1]UEA75629.1 DAK2 domain-containing protein [Lachnospiraceae bacterium GAM79]EDO59217.1 DAK2 domain fusion protein YloV [Clostridium sp. L2-50]UEA76363.1 DAK2 domain-containing protein [Lachnospiraceae bacterium GAM79]